MFLWTDQRLPVLTSKSRQTLAYVSTGRPVLAHHIYCSCPGPALLFSFNQEQYSVHRFYPILLHYIGAWLLAAAAET
jgi:hypothetical protein